MSYPGNPPGGQPYSYPDAQGYPQPVPPQPAPLHDQPVDPFAAQGGGTQQYPADPFGQPNYGYAVDAPGQQPVSGSPVGPGMPMSGPPMSGPPVSAPPTMAAYAPAGPPAAKRSGLTIALAIASAVLLLAAGIMTALYAGKSGDLTDANRTIASQKTTIGDNETKIKDLTAKQTELQGQLDRTNTDLSGSQSQAAELKRQKTVISKCLDLFAQVTVAASNGDTATAQAKAQEAGPICDEAEKYLG